MPDVAASTVWRTRALRRLLDLAVVERLQRHLALDELLLEHLRERPSAAPRLSVSSSIVVAPSARSTLSVPLKSKRVASSRCVWSTALRTSCMSTSETTSNVGMALLVSSEASEMALLLYDSGSVPEWPKGTGCKPVAQRYVGSNPTRPTGSPDRASRFALTACAASARRRATGRTCGRPLVRGRSSRSRTRRAARSSARARPRCARSPSGSRDRAARPTSSASSRLPMPSAPAVVERRRPSPRPWCVGRPRPVRRERRETDHDARAVDRDDRRMATRVFVDPVRPARRGCGARGRR